MSPGRPYVGRFAPSPTGRLHLGSMVAAVASYLDAAAHGGVWLVRMEDLDPPREVPGAADDILRTLEGFGLTWDHRVEFQSQRHEYYHQALADLRSRNLAFGCICSRRELMDADGLAVYPGTCRNGLSPGIAPRSWRFRMPAGENLSWFDRWRGHQSVARTSVGDVVLQRADGHWAYHLAVVVDDAEQGVTHVVRGADLIDATAAHIAIRTELQAPEILYTHVPIMTNEKGQKLSKQTLATPVEIQDASAVLHLVFGHLGISGISVDKPGVMLQQAARLWLQRMHTLSQEKERNQG